MKKIIAAFDGLKYMKSTRDYAIQLAQNTQAHLVGVFLEDFTYSSYKIYDLIAKEEVTEKTLRKFDEKDRQVRLSAVTDFENKCQESGLNYTIHRDKNLALQELLHETIYADLLIIHNGETLTHYDEKLPTRFIRELLPDTQCPVLLVPPTFNPIDRIILLYDGGPSSVYAIKMFSYLFPLRTDTPITLLNVKNPHQSLHLPDNKLMKEFTKKHYPKISFTVLKGIAEDEIVGYLQTLKGNPLVVCGSYNRGMVSRWLKSSLADVLMKEMKIPLFIAHNR